jgi:hypothetical protein
MTRSRFRLSELGPARVAAAAGRRLADLPSRLAWAAPGGAAASNRARLAAYADRHAGQRCFVIGNGPSLGAMDLSPLRGEVSFAANRLYLLFGSLPFAPSYYCATNELVLRQFAAEIAQLPMPKFLSWTRRRDFARARGETLFVRTALSLRDFFAGDPRRALGSGGTVTFTALQLAFFMGFTQVVLIGVDHAFAESGPPNATRTRRGPDQSHCHPDYFPPGSRWQLPDLRRSELAYGLARRAYERAGRRVLDATPGGKLDVFEKVAFESLFEA